MDFNGEEFSENGYIENNIKNLINKNVINGTDQVIILVVGGSNTGKTSLSLLAKNYIEGGVNTEDIALNHEEFMDLYTTNKGDPETPPKKVIIYEEGRDSFFRANNITKENKEAKNSLFEYRSYQNVVFINFQDISDFAPKPILNNLVDFCIRLTKPGTAHLYGQSTLKSMFSRGNYTKFMGWTDPDVVDHFDDPRDLIPEKFEKYKKQNISKLNNKNQDDEDENKNPVGTNRFKPTELNINTKDANILSYLKKNGTVTSKDFLDEGLFNHRQNIHNNTKNLEEKGLIKIEKGRRNRYTLTKKGEGVLAVIS